MKSFANISQRPRRPREDGYYQLQDTSQPSGQYSQSSFSTEYHETATSETLPLSTQCDTPMPGLFNVSSNILTTPIAYVNNTEGYSSPSTLVSVAADTLSKPLAKFTIFPKLPLEIRFKIYNLSLEPRSCLYVKTSQMAATTSHMYGLQGSEAGV